MKVLFCAYDRPGLVATGPNAWIQRLLPDLSRIHKLDVSILVLYKGDVEECPTLNFFKKTHIQVHALNVGVKPYVEDQIKTILRIVKAERIFTLVANLVIPAYYSARYLRPFGVKVIGVIHSNDTFYHSVIRNFVNSNSKNNLSAFVAVSKYLENLTTENKNSEVEVFNIPCGTPLTSNDEIVRDPTKKLKVVYAGRLEVQQKQILKLTKSFFSASNHIPDSEYTIYGSGSAESDVVSLIDKSESKTVVFGGSIAPSEIHSHLSKHDVFTLMSDYEGMPIALMEAMSLGLVPVCLKEDSGINEIIDHGVNGFIVENRNEDYIEKLEFLANNPEVYEKMSRASTETIKSKYSTAITHLKWAELLKSYSNTKVKRIRLPLHIQIKDKPLEYGDFRKPPFGLIVKKKMSDLWMQFRLFVRPRARIKSLKEKLNEKA